MVYDKSYYELLLLIENKIQSIESKSQEVALPDNLRVQLENIKQAADSAYQSICIALTTVPPLQRRNDMPRGTGNKTAFSWGRFYIERPDTDDEG